MEWKKRNIKIVQPWHLAERVERKPRKRNVKPLAATDFSADDRKKFWGNVKKGKRNECWEWQGTRSKGGYGIFRPHGKKRNALVASRVALVLSGRPPNKLLALHSCDNPPCCNPHHLWPDTDLHNSWDASEKKRLRGRKYTPLPDGRKEPRAKLKAQDVINIRYRSKLGESGVSLARDYNVVPSTIYEILNYSKWWYVKQPSMNVEDY